MEIDPDKLSLIRRPISADAPNCHCFCVILSDFLPYMGEKPMLSNQNADYALWSQSENKVSSFAYFPEVIGQWYYLLHIHSGDGKFFIQSRQISPVHQDCLLFFSASSSYSLSAAAKPLQFTSFLINGGTAALLSPLVIQQVSDRLQSILHLIENHTDLNAPGEKSGLLSIFFAELRRTAEAIPAATKNQRRPSHILKMILDTRYMQPLKLDQFARELYVNKFYLVREFKQDFGITPIEYLLNRRIEEACRLLCETKMKVTEIGGLVGIPNTTYFTRVF